MKSQKYKSRVILSTILICFLIIGLTTLQVSSQETTPIMGETKASQEQLIQYYNDNIISYPSEYLDKGVDMGKFVEIVMQESQAEGVRADIVFAQALLKTGGLSFNAEVGIDQNNFGEFKNQEDQYISFESIQEGIRANVQYLKLQASEDPLNENPINSIDELISSTLRGEITNVEDLENGEDIKGILQEMIETKQTISSDDMQQNEDAQDIKEEELTITFNTLGGSSVEPTTVGYYSLIKDIPEPTKEGYIFSGWYQDKDYKDKWDVEEDKVVEDITLYAKWKKEDETSEGISGVNKEDDTKIINNKTDVATSSINNLNVSKAIQSNAVGVTTYNAPNYEIAKMNALSMSYLEINVANALKVRKGPSSSYDRIDVVYNNERYLIQDVSENGWYQIRTQSGKTGWVSGNRVKILNFIEIETSSVSSRLLVREGPSSSYDRISTVGDGEVYEILETSSNGPGWFKIRLQEGRVGWVSANHVKVKQHKTQAKNSIPIKKLEVKTSSPSSSLLVRQGPSSSYDRINTVRYGEIFDVLDITSNGSTWYKISLGEDGAGWVSGNYIDILRSITIETSSSSSRLIVRGGPSSSYDRISTVGYGEVYRILNTSSSGPGWYKIKTKEGKIGWVSANFTRQLVTHTRSDLESSNLKYMEIVTSSSLIVRGGPSSSYDRIGTVESKDAYIVLDTSSDSPGWFKIRTNEGDIGWVSRNHSSYVRHIEVTTSSLSSRLIVREGPSSSYANINTVGYGEIYEVLDTASNGIGWYKIRTKEGHTGWVSGSFVNVVDKQSRFNYTQYNLTLEEALDIQMRVRPQTDMNYAYVSAAYIDTRSRVTATTLNVRSGPSTSRHIVGSLSNGATVQIISEVNGWYQIRYSGAGWVDAARADVLYYLNPNNFLDDDRQRFQFLDLSRASGASASLFNQYLDNKGILEGKGHAFIEAGRIHGVNDAYLLSHALLETGHGSSTLATGVEVGKDRDGSLVLVNSNNRNRLSDIRTTYNMYGIGAIDSNPLEGGAIRAYREGWFTPEASIIGGAQFIGNSYVKAGQNTLYKMRWNPLSMEINGRASNQYATDIGWASKQVNTMYNLYRDIGITTVYLDIPQYL